MNFVIGLFPEKAFNDENTGVDDLLFCLQNDSTMALSTTIIRFSPTPPVEAQPNLDSNVVPKSLDNMLPQYSKSLDPLPAEQRKSPEPSRSASALSCTRSHSECNHRCPGDVAAGCRNHKHGSESDIRKFHKLDSGYSSNLYIQQTNCAAPQGSQQWGLSLPPPYSAEGLHYAPIPSCKPPCPGMMDLPHKGDIQSLLTRRSFVNSQLPLQYLGPEAALHPFHVGPAGNTLYSMSSTGKFRFLYLKINNMLSKR